MLYKLILPYNYSSNLAYQSGMKITIYFYEIKMDPNSLSVIFPRRQGREGCGIRKTGSWILWEKFPQSRLRVSRIRKSLSYNIQPRKVYWSLQKKLFEEYLYSWKDMSQNRSPTATVYTALFYKVGCMVGVVGTIEVGGH